MSNALPNILCEGFPLHVEVLQKRISMCNRSLLMAKVQNILEELDTVRLGCILRDFTDGFLKEHIMYIKICSDAVDEMKVVSLKTASLEFHFYKLENEGPSIEDLGDGEEEIPAATYWALPAAEFENYWEELIYESHIKEQLLKYVKTTQLFSSQGVEKSIISWNKVVLLHGPPGTGKTSLCKALAQKLSIRLEKKYNSAQLIEINSHSLFSKWFSESGKLVQKMFTKITELIEDPKTLVLVLIDEVESLTSSRASSSSGSDPGDAVRVVNAVLTQIDQLNKYPNVLILTTSNISGTVDIAFVDRADIKQYIGLPSCCAIYQIYYTCVMELKRVGIIIDKEIIFALQELQALEKLNAPNTSENDVTRLSLCLWEVSRLSEGLSGRTLRKIPLIAHALFIDSPATSFALFLQAMEKAVEKQHEDRRKLST